MHTIAKALMSGTVWKFGDNIDTDLLAPGAYMKGPLEELARHCLEAVDAGFAARVKPGDVLVAGRNFGMGSSREQAAQVLGMLGVKAVLATSFGGIFYRNAFNLGLLALVSPDVATFEQGEQVEIDASAGIVRSLSKGEQRSCEAIPPHLAAIVNAGGLIPYLKKNKGSAP